MKYRFLSTALISTSLVLASLTVNAHETDDAADGPSRYPTAAIADYVLGCMAANGNTFEALHQCSCSIDYISERIPYEDYERIQTVMQVQQDRGQRGIFYRDSNWAKSRVEALQKVQAESTLRCF